jgi:transposase-like protein/IS1 family transposase
MDASPSPRPVCRQCSSPAIRWGKDRGFQRWRCKACGSTWADIPARPLGTMRLPLETATLCISLLTEGSSIRSTERVTGVHRDTICRLLRVAGRKCETLLAGLVRGVKVADVQCDELWSFVSMKEKVKVRKGITSPEVGDAYTFLAVERGSKLLLAHHVGRRTSEHADLFASKLSRAVGADRFQLSTDGWEGYPAALEQHLGGQIDYAMLIKSYSGEGLDSDRRYSPPAIIATEKRVISGSPVESQVCTSHVERLNLHVRMMSRRFTRLTTGFSRKHENLRAAVSLFAATYNLTWAHRTLKGCTPAMAAGLARKPWTVRELLTA